MTSFQPGDLILAIDVGSSSVRATVCDLDGNLLDGDFVQEHHQLQTTADGGATFEAEALLQRIFRCIDGILAQAAGKGARIAAVVMDTLVGNVLGVDSAGNALTPLYTWADTRGGPRAGELERRLLEAELSAADYSERTGCRLHTSYWPLRLLWYGESHAAEPAPAYWMSLGEYLLFRLFGKRRVSLSTASWGGLFNRHTLDWDDRVLAALKLERAQLSTPSGEPLSGLTGEWLARWPQLGAANWFPSIADGVGSNLGVGCLDPGRVALSVGTSGALRVIVPATPATTPDGLFVYRVDAARSLVGGALSNAGNLYAWMYQTLKLPEHTALEAELAAMAPDSHGLTILPFLAGERAPGWNPHAQAVFMGMTQNTSPHDLVRAGLESIAYRFYQIAERLRPHLQPDAVFVASGAAILNSPAWMQIIADTLNSKVYGTTERETTIRGAVLLATGRQPGLQLGQVYTPDPARHAVYAEAVERQKALYGRISA